MKIVTTLLPRLPAFPLPSSQATAGELCRAGPPAVLAQNRPGRGAPTCGAAGGRRGPRRVPAERSAPAQPCCPRSPRPNPALSEEKEIVRRRKGNPKRNISSQCSLTTPIPGALQTSELREKQGIGNAGVLEPLLEQKSGRKRRVNVPSHQRIIHCGNLLPFHDNNRQETRIKQHEKRPLSRLHPAGKAWLRPRLQEGSEWPERWRFGKKRIAENHHLFCLLVFCYCLF